MIHGSEIVTEAMKHRGKPYRWGGNGPEIFDCSGLVIYILHKFDLLDETIDMTADDIFKFCKRNGGKLLTVDEARGTTGALIFRRNVVDKRISHVGVCTGVNSTIEAMGVESGVGEWQIDHTRSWSEGVQIPNVFYEEEI